MSLIPAIDYLPDLKRNAGKTHAFLLLVLAKEFNVIRIPTVVYQNMCDICIHYHLLEDRQKEIQRQLLEYIEEGHPGYSLESFIDLSKDEALAIHPNLQWGMYIKLLEDGNKPSQLLLEDAFKQLPEVFKQISNGH